MMAEEDNKESATNITKMNKTNEMEQPPLMSMSSNLTSSAASTGGTGSSNTSAAGIDCDNKISNSLASLSIREGNGNTDKDKDDSSTMNIPKPLGIPTKPPNSDNSSSNPSNNQQAPPAPMTTQPSRLGLLTRSLAVEEEDHSRPPTPNPQNLQGGAGASSSNNEKERQEEEEEQKGGDEGEGMVSPRPLSPTTTQLLSFLKSTMLKSTKDRNIIFRIETDLVQYVREKGRTTPLPFPSMSSYHRMLVHRIATLFNLDHNIDPIGNCVVVSKNQERTERLPGMKFRDLLMEDGFDDGQDFKARVLLKREESGEGRDMQQRKPQLNQQRSLEQRTAEYSKARARIFSNSVPHRASESFDEGRFSRNNSTKLINTKNKSSSFGGYQQHQMYHQRAQSHLHPNIPSSSSSALLTTPAGSLQSSLSPSSASSSGYGRSSLQMLSTSTSCSSDYFGEGDGDQQQVIQGQGQEMTTVSPIMSCGAQGQQGGHTPQQEVSPGPPGGGTPHAVPLPPHHPMQTYHVVPQVQQQFLSSHQDYGGHGHSPAPTFVQAPPQLPHFTHQPLMMMPTQMMPNNGLLNNPNPSPSPHLPLHLNHQNMSMMMSMPNAHPAMQMQMQMPSPLSLPPSSPYTPHQPQPNIIYCYIPIMAPQPQPPPPQQQPPQPQGPPTMQYYNNNNDTQQQHQQYNNNHHNRFRR